MKRKYKIIDGKFFYYKESKTKSKILELVSKKEMNITELSNKVGIAYNNLFLHIKELEEMGIIEKEYTREQTNPVIIKLSPKIKSKRRKK